MARNKSGLIKQYGFSKGQGPYSTKRWTRNIFLQMGSKDPEARKKSLFLNEGQAIRALKKLLKAQLKSGLRLMEEEARRKLEPQPMRQQPAKPSRGSRVVTLDVPRHIHERGLHAQIYLDPEVIKQVTAEFHEKHAEQLASIPS